MHSVVGLRRTKLRRSNAFTYVNLSAVASRAQQQFWRAIPIAFNSNSSKRFQFRTNEKRFDSVCVPERDDAIGVHRIVVEQRVGVLRFELAVVKRQAVAKLVARLGVVILSPQVRV